MHSVSLAHSCRLAKSHKNKTAILQNTLDKAENQSFPSNLPREIYLNSLKEKLNEETNEAVQGQIIRGGNGFL